MTPFYKILKRSFRVSGIDDAVIPADRTSNISGIIFIIFNRIHYIFNLILRSMDLPNARGAKMAGATAAAVTADRNLGSVADASAPWHGLECAVRLPKSQMTVRSP